MNIKQIHINKEKHTLTLDWKKIKFNAFSYLWSHLVLYKNWKTEINLWKHKIYINWKLRWSNVRANGSFFKSFIT